ncbi:hypothetical protein LIER_34875 [Lithospermum erythrorhizon]|uniref:Late embryogenesis abundant protein LEA-2 subgroup domain-containing protein n=1 Tax=Lithospermum erythrorhizon TaxID=34254 RepID=A0AAV3S3V9_LITER
MANHRRDSSEEALFHSYPYEVYYVHSPSTISHANSPDLRTHNTHHLQHQLTPLALLQYSSSRGSTHSFNFHDKKVSFDLQSCHEEEAENAMEIGGDSRRKCVTRDSLDDEDDYFGDGEKGWKQYFSFGYSSSFSWICLQISWRFVVSLFAALLVFYLAAKPPAPVISVKIARIRQFVLAEGVDGTGVSTKMLSCNFTIDLVIDNQSKMFALRLHPPAMSISFAKLPFVLSRGMELRAGPGGPTTSRLFIGKRNKPLYGAGRSMQDMLESRLGLPLEIIVDLRSKFHVLGNLIKQKYHHQAHCLLNLHGAYDKAHRSHIYNSTCVITS